jgi:hypothetical protein
VEFGTDGKSLGGGKARLGLGSASGAAGVCAFWDEAQEQWLSDGLSLEIDAEGNIWCETPHLTFFAFISRPFEALAETLLCSTLNVLSADGLKRLPKGDWATRPSAIVFWSILVALLLLLIYGCYLDHSERNSRELWSESRFLEHGGEKGEKSGFMRDAFQSLILDMLGCVRHLNKLKGVAQATTSRDSVSSVDTGHTNASLQTRKAKSFTKTIIKKVDSIRRQVVKFTILACISHRTKIARDDVKHGLQISKESAPDVRAISNGAREIRSHEDSQADSRIVAALSRHAPNVMAKLQEEPDVLMLKVNGCLRSAYGLYCLFVSSHPLHICLAYSIFTSHAMRSCIVAGTILGPALIQALFFSVSGDALSFESSDKCAKTNDLFRAVGVGISSWLLMSLPMLALGTQVKRFFVPRTDWNEESKERFLRQWKRQDRIVYFCLLLYVLLCIGFVVTFLANVRPGDDLLWLQAFVTALVEDFFFAPLALALFLHIIFEITRYTQPRVIEKIYVELRCEAETAKRNKASAVASQQLSPRSSSSSDCSRVSSPIASPKGSLSPKDFSKEKDGMGLLNASELGLSLSLEGGRGALRSHWTNAGGTLSARSPGSPEREPGSCLVTSRSCMALDTDSEFQIELPKATLLAKISHWQTTKGEHVSATSPGPRAATLQERLEDDRVSSVGCPLWSPLCTLLAGARTCDGEVGLPD